MKIYDPNNYSGCFAFLLMEFVGLLLFLYIISNKESFVFPNARPYLAVAIILLMIWPILGGFLEVIKKNNRYKEKKAKKPETKEVESKEDKSPPPPSKPTNGSRL